MFIMFTIATTLPLDVSAVASTLAGYVALGAVAGLSIFVGIYSIKIILRAFKSVGDSGGNYVDGYHGRD
jgi:hypothetical protein